MLEQFGTERVVAYRASFCVLRVAYRASFCVLRRRARSPLPFSG